MTSADEEQSTAESLLSYTAQNCSYVDSGSHSRFRGTSLDLALPVSGSERRFQLKSGMQKMILATAWIDWQFADCVAASFPDYGGPLCLVLENFPGAPAILCTYTAPGPVQRVHSQQPCEQPPEHALHLLTPCPSNYAALPESAWLSVPPPLLAEQQHTSSEHQPTLEGGVDTPAAFAELTAGPFVLLGKHQPL